MASTTPTPSYTLRAATRNDWDFIWSLRQETMRPTIDAAYGWVESAQKEYARASLAGRIVLLDDKPAGVVTITDWGHELHIVWMAVVPAVQGRGLGTALLAQACEEAVALSKPLTLQVLRNNPAMRLYERHGFEAYEENGPHRILMRWNRARA